MLGHTSGTSSPSKLFIDVKSSLEMDFSDDDSYGEITQLPPEVTKAISEVLPSDDPMDSPEFDVVSHINQLFPTEQSLSSLNDVISNVETKINEVDSEIRGFVRDQTGKGGQDGITALARAQASIEALVAKVLDMKGRAEQSEAAVRDMTRDIRQLDTAKRNLMTAITTLNHLNMLVTGVEKLQTLVKTRQYGDAAQLLQGVANVVEHFDGYQNIPQISELSERVKETKKGLGEQIRLEFRESFSNIGAGSLNVKQMSEACLVLDVLEPHVKHELLQWFISLQLKEYGVLFDVNDDFAWLDKIDRRYAWLKKHLIQFEERFGSIFPVEWDLSQRIAVHFCHETRLELSKVMNKRRHEIDVKVLLSAIQKTTAFENLLFLRFGGNAIRDERDSNDSPSPILRTKDEILSSPTEEIVEASAQESNKKFSNKFNRIITQCFDPFLYIYVESQDKNLSELIEKFASELRFPTPKASDCSGVVLANCADLFVFYKKCLVQCTQLSCGEPLLNLGIVFSKRLRDYCSRILQANLPKISSNTSSLTSVSNFTKELRDLSTSNLIHNFQSLLKEGENLRFSRDELYKISCILTTSEYCVETTLQLEEKLKEKLGELKEKLNMSSDKCMFMEVIDACISLLVHDLDCACSPALTSMSKTAWQSVEKVGDQSGYVSAIISQWKATVPTFRDFLATSRKYFVIFCQQYAKLFMTKYVAALYKCKGVSKEGAHQLLLDTQSLKTSLLDLPSIGLTVKRKPSDKYSKAIVQDLGKMEMVLKLVMSNTESAAMFVDQIIKFLPDCDLTELIRILEMKGVKKAEQGSYVEYYRTRSSNGNVTQEVTTMDNVIVNESVAESSRIRKLEKLIKKRL